MTDANDIVTGYIPQEYIIPADPKEKDVRLRYYLNDIASAVNSKDTGYYYETKVLTGKVFIPTLTPTASSSILQRDIFRIVVLTDTLSTGTNTIPHNLTVGSTWHFTQIYGVIEDTAAPEWVPIPNADITVSVDATDIVIIIGAAYNGYSGHVILEWVEED